MIERIIKRDGKRVKFSERRIRTAISNAMRSANESTYNVIQTITQACIDAINVKYDCQEPHVEDIQNTIIDVLLEMNLQEVAEEFESYREERTKCREMKSDVMRAISKISKETERDNANVGNNFSAKLLQIASIASKWSNLATMPKEFAKAHEKGDIHIHDLDSYRLTVNCLHVPTEKVLKSGFNTGYGYIRPPKSIESAAELSCILLQSTQNDMFGGQSHVDFDNAMANYLEPTRNKIRKDIDKSLELIDRNKRVISAEQYDDLVEEKLNERLHQAMQGVVYNLNTMHSRAGSQVPFSSVNIGIPKSEDAAKVCQAFLEEYEKGLGKGEQPIFPNIIFRLKKGVNANEEDPYYYLTKIAVRVSAKRMNPTFRLLDCSLSLPFYERGIVAATMGCRTDTLANINAKDSSEEGPSGRGNIAPVTINLVRLGIESKGDWNKFFKSLDTMMTLCKRQLMHRYDVLKELRVSDLPFVAGQGLMVGSEGLKPEDSIEPILKHGTFAIGFIGLAETLVAMMGKHHGESEEAYEKAKEIINFMYKNINKYKDELHLNFSLYATPAESLSGRFVKIDQKKYGDIERVTDRGFYTNSFHVPVDYNISAIKKADIEAPFHSLCTGGHISYFEIDGGDLKTRENYISRHLRHCLDKTDISYVAYNFRIRYCKSCGENMTLDMTECPKCGGTDIQGISRVTGYMSLDERFTPGKVAEREARIKHKL